MKTDPRDPYYSDKFTPEDVHSLSTLALDPKGKFSDLLLATIKDEGLIQVAKGLRGEIPLEELGPRVRSAVETFKNWANPPFRRSNSARDDGLCPESMELTARIH